MKGSKRHNRHRTPKVINKGLDYELLAKNVFLLLKNKDFILAHEDMRDCVVNVKNFVCINNCDLNYMPLSGYLEWWDKAQEVMHANEDNLRGVVIRWACSPMSGINNCDLAFENGQIEKWRIRAFKTDVHSWLAVRRKYDNVLEYPSKLTLRDVIDKLKKMNDFV